MNNIDFMACKVLGIFRLTFLVTVILMTLIGLALGLGPGLDFESPLVLALYTILAGLILYIPYLMYSFVEERQGIVANSKIKWRFVTEKEKKNFVVECSTYLLIPVILFLA